MAAHEIAEVEHEGFPAHRLTSHPGELEAIFVAQAGMVGASLRHRGEEVLGQRKGLANYAETGSSMGIPLLHPWANRLDGFAYAVAGRKVEFSAESAPVRLAGGLPIHGLLSGSPLWEVTGAQAGEEGARLDARLDFGAHEQLLAAFPFPHELIQTVYLWERSLSIETTLRATGEGPVPVSFGYHPYLRLPGVPRSEWRAEMPVGRQAVLDERSIPTGEWRDVELPPGELGGLVLDDLFTDLGRRPVFAISAAGRELRVRFDQGYPYAVVWSPEGEDFICFEPMTAPTNALVTGEGLRLVEPGDAFTARFTVTVG